MIVVTITTVISGISATAATTAALIPSIAGGVNCSNATFLSV
jgi:hypothetical protein